MRRQSPSGPSPSFVDSTKLGLSALLASAAHKVPQELGDFAWHQWQEADDLQLDTHFKAGTIGHPVPRPPKDPNVPSQTFQLHWAQLVKPSGVRKSRACLDGSKLSAPWLCMLVQTYSSCVDLACLHAFIALMKRPLHWFHSWTGSSCLLSSRRLCFSCSRQSYCRVLHF